MEVSEPSAGAFEPARGVGLGRPLLSFGSNLPPAHCLPWKKTPLRSCPTTEYTFLVGFGASDTNWNPAWLEDHAIVAPVRTNWPVKSSFSLVTIARSITPLHSMSNETIAGTGAIAGIGGFENPFPPVSALAISCASLTGTLLMRSDAVPAPGSTCTTSSGAKITQNNPLAEIPGL